MLRVLVLDDELSVLRMVTDYLAAPGIAVTSCLEIEAAESLLRCYPFHVVVADLKVSMLGELEGLRLVRFAATHFPSLRTYVLSGQLHDGVRDLALSMGATDLFEKPTGLVRLRQVVLQARDLQGPGATDAPAEKLHVDRLEDYLTSGSITAVFQPIVRLGRGDPPYEVAGCESLARGPVSSPLSDPRLLFTYAAARERLHDADHLCVATALQQAQQLPRHLPLYLNINPRSLAYPEFVSTLREEVVAADRDPKRIVLEMTEHQDILDSQAFHKALAEIRRQGFAIALDDFGEGHSNLQALKELRPDVVKISCAFSRGLEADETTPVILSSQTLMATKLGMRTVGESIESPQEARLLYRCGVEMGQGYYFCRPRCAEELLGVPQLELPRAPA